MEGDGGGGEGPASPHVPGPVGERPVDPQTCRERLPSRGYVEKSFSGRWSYTPSPIRQTTSGRRCMAFLGVGGLCSADVTVSYADLISSVGPGQGECSPTPIPQSVSFQSQTHSFIRIPFVCCCYFLS